MNNKLYVGNLSFAVTQQDLLDFFMAAGTVLEAIVVTDRSTGNSRGFGFVTMSSENEAMNAIQQLNGHDLLGREIQVKIAMERQERGPRNYSDRRESRGGFERRGEGRQGSSQGRGGHRSGGGGDFRRRRSD